MLWPDPRLSAVCESVKAFKVEALACDLLDTMYAAKGRGLAAPQIGVMARVFVVDAWWKSHTPDPRVFINPVVLNLSDQVEAVEEQCLSIPACPMPVSRPIRVQLHWENVDGGSVSRTFEGIEARCILHELDHLDGRMIFDHQTPALRAELEAAYAG